MKRYKVIFLPQAERRLDAIEAYIAERASQAIAERFVAALVDWALKLDSFPSRGTPRDDLMQAFGRSFIDERSPSPLWWMATRSR